MKYTNQKASEKYELKHTFQIIYCIIHFLQFCDRIVRNGLRKKMYQLQGEENDKKNSTKKGKLG